MLAFRYIFTHMNIRLKIALYSLCLVLTLSWVSVSVSHILKASTEKNAADKKEALPEGKSEMEDKKFEIAYDFSAFYNLPFLAKPVTLLQFSKVATIPQSIFLDQSNPPPEFYLFA